MKLNISVVRAALLNPLGVAALSVFFIAYLQALPQRQYQISANKKIHFAPPRDLYHFSIGYAEVLADSTWLRALQDFDLCEQNLRPDDAPRIGKNRITDCNKGWLFHMLDVVTEFAPRWLLPASVGGIVLSVVVDDIEGATIIFEKGLKNHPTDWTLNYRAAYHYLYELEDNVRAADLYMAAAKNGGPKWLYGLVGKLYTQTGRALLARNTLVEFLQNNPDLDLPTKERILIRIKKAEAELSRAEVDPSTKIKSSTKNK